VTAPATHVFAFNGPILQRGFWLYVWEIRAGEGPPLYYVGRTGDSSSPNAQSPFNRMGQHLGFNDKSNVLRRRLMKLGVAPETCDFRLVTCGPIFPQADSVEGHRGPRDVVAAMEKALAEAMVAAGYHVINEVGCTKPLDRELFGTVRTALAQHFPCLNDGPKSIGAGTGSGMINEHDDSGTHG